MEEGRRKKIPGVADHKGHLLGGDGFGRTDQIAFILALGRVQHDDEFAVPCPDESAVPISPFAHSAPKSEFVWTRKKIQKNVRNASTVSSMVSKRRLGLLLTCILHLQGF